MKSAKEHGASPRMEGIAGLYARRRRDPMVSAEDVLQDMLLERWKADLRGVPAEVRDVTAVVRVKNLHIRDALREKRNRRAVISFEDAPTCLLVTQSAEDTILALIDILKEEGPMATKKNETKKNETKKTAPTKAVATYGARLDLNLIDAARVREYAGEVLPDELPAKTSTKAIVAALAEHAKARAAEGATIVACWRCHADFEEAPGDCPFCGAPEDEPAPADKPAEIVVADDVAPTLTEADLDERVKWLRDRTSDTGETVWRLGQGLYETHQTGIWRLRKNEDGSPKYKYFRDFINAELPFSARWGEGIMGIAREYTLEQVQQIGRTKLMHLLRLDAPAREELLPIAGAMSERELKEAVDEIKTASEEPKAPKKPKKEREREVHHAEIVREVHATTCVIPHGSHRIELNKRSTTRELVLTEADLKERPFGVLSLDHGVTLSVYLERRNSDGAYTVVLEALRDD